MTNNKYYEVQKLDSIWPLTKILALVSSQELSIASKQTSEGIVYYQRKIFVKVRLGLGFTSVILQ